MLKNWTSHADYQNFVSSNVSSFDQSQLKRFSSFHNSIAKLTSLNLDPLGTILKPYYSSTGRPAILQPEIFRSFIFMLDQKETRLTTWVQTLKSDDMLAFIIGCSPDSLPALGSYYDFIDRLWLRHKDLERARLKNLFPFLRKKPFQLCQEKTRNFLIVILALLSTLRTFC